MIKKSADILDEYLQTEPELTDGQYHQCKLAMEEYKNQYLHPPQTEAWFEAVNILKDALENIASNEGTCCMRCEGNGKLWADGQSHYPSYEGPTVNCGHCGGEGRLYEDLQGIAIDALNEFEKRPVRPVAALPDAVGLDENDKK